MCVLLSNLADRSVLGCEPDLPVYFSAFREHTVWGLHDNAPRQDFLIGFGGGYRFASLWAKAPVHQSLGLIKTFKSEGLSSTWTSVYHFTLDHHFPK